VGCPSPSVDLHARSLFVNVLDDTGKTRLAQDLPTSPSAFLDQAACRANPDAERAAWLRRMLANDLADVLRARTRARRDIDREVSIDAALGESSAQIGLWIASPGPSPSQEADKHEQAIRLATALAGLPEAEQEALVLQHWHGLTVAQIGARLSRTPAAIGGLLKRGLKRLRERMSDPATDL